MSQKNKSVSCDIVKDLLPLYVDNICSEESKETIEQHMYECVECKQYLESMENQSIEETLKNDNEQIIERHKRKIKEQMITIAILCVTSTMILFAAVWMFIYSGESIAQEYMTIHTSEYGNWDGHIESERESINSGLYIFPESISSAMDSQYIYYHGIDNHSISGILIYTEVNYSDEDYEKEVERLTNIKCDIRMSLDGETVTKNIMYSEELFKYPAYVAVYASNNSYEYALVDEINNKIVYVYLQLKDGNGIISQEYLPIETINKDMYENISWDNQNIYYEKNEDGDYEDYIDDFGSEK